MARLLDVSATGRRKVPRAVVEDGLRHRWSPQQISRRLVHDYPEDPTMRVPHETIYTSLFVQAKRGYLDS